MTAKQIHRLVRSIRPLNLGVAIRLTGMAAGRSRNISDIVAVARNWQADERIVAMLYGFAPSLNEPSKWTDLLTTDAPAIVDRCNRELRAAFMLSKLAFGSDQIAGQILFDRAEL